MTELQTLLPHSVIAAVLPALALITFFWKGDEALSAEFKQWITQRIYGVDLSASRLSGIEPLSRVFDFIYGARYFSLNSFFRVAGVSTIAAIISFSIPAILNPQGAWENIRNIASTRQSFEILLLFLFVNYSFDYISVTKARLIMHGMIVTRLRYTNILFLIVDGVATVLVLNAYAFLFSRVIAFFYPVTEHDMFGWMVMFNYFFVVYAFYGTTFLIFFLTAMYLLSLWSLIAFGVMPVLSLVRWILPVRQLPVRSIGVMAGVILFIGLSVGGLFHGPSMTSLLNSALSVVLFSI